MATFLPSKPGWYPNPMDRTSLRYWDGAHWTARYRKRPLWLSQQSDLEPWTIGYDRAIEGPVHPRELREPVVSGAASHQGLARWRALQAYRAWHRPLGYAPGVRGPESAPAATKFGPGRRPLLLFMAMAVVAVAVVLSSVALMAPYDRPGDTAALATQAGQSRFVALAGKACSTTLPRYRLTLLTGVDGPSVAAASRQVDRLRLRLSSLHPSAGIEAPVEAWLSDWQQFSVSQRLYASLVGPADHRSGRLVARPLSPQAQAAAMEAHRRALALARQADHYAANLHLNACLLEQAGSV